MDHLRHRHPAVGIHRLCLDSCVGLWTELARVEPRRDEGTKGNAMTECVRCGIMVSDFYYEELGLDIEDAADLLFEQVNGETYCQGCAPKGTHDESI